MLMLTELKLKSKSLATPGRYVVGGVSGLYVQVSLGKDGTPRRSFVLRYKFAGRAREMGLGAYPAVSLAEARDRAREAAALKARGIDPLAAKATAREAEALKSAEAHVTFEQAAKMLLKHLCQQRADTNSCASNRPSVGATGFAIHVFPKIGKLDVRDLRHADIARVQTSNGCNGRAERNVHCWRLSPWPPIGVALAD